MHYLSFLDYVAFIAVLCSSTFIGLYHAWKSRNLQSENEKKKSLYGGRDMGVIPISISLVASFMSIGSVLGVPAEIYTHSVSIFMCIIGGFLGIAICRTVFLPMFYDLQLPSVNTYLQKRFAFPALRIFTSLTFVFMNIFSAGIAIYGPALAISSVTPLHVNASIIAVGFVCTLYTSLGGMKAVVWTDVLQFSVMTIGLLMVAVKGTFTAGGWDQVWHTASEGNLLQFTNFHIDPVYGVPAVYECVLGFLVGFGGMFSTNQMSVQRFCSLPTKKDAVHSIYLSITIMMSFVCLSCYCGVVIFANYYGCDPLLTKEIFSPDQLLPYYVMQHLSFMPGVAGIFVAAVFSGSLSTISSFINSVTIVVWQDLLKRFVTVSVKTENILVKTIAFTFGFTTTALAFLLKGLGTVMEVATIFFGAVFGPQFGMFLLGALCPFVDGASATFGFVMGQVFVITINLTAMILGRPQRRLPTSLDQCPDVNGTGYATVLLLNMTDPDLLNENGQTHQDVYWVHNISLFFLPFLGCVATIVSGILATAFTGGMKREDLDFRYVSPVIRRFFRKPDKKKYQTVEVSLMESTTKTGVDCKEMTYTSFNVQRFQ